VKRLGWCAALINKSGRIANTDFEKFECFPGFPGFPGFAAAALHAPGMLAKQALEKSPAKSRWRKRTGLLSSCQRNNQTPAAYPFRALRGEMD